MSQDRLNDSYRTLRTSLLQYVAENSPWTPYADEASVKKLQTIVARQNEQIQRLADFIVNRQGYLPGGSYPSDFTDMQYLSLAYLLKKLIPDQQRVLETLESNRKNISNDAGASDMLSQLEVGVAENLQDLKELAESSNHEEAAAAE
jgi:hypothetical protein